MIEWQQRLRRARRARGYLIRERGLWQETLDRYGFGWDGRAITLPIYDADRQLVNVRRREVGSGHPFIGLRGRGSQLFPITAVTGRGPLAICEGEFDALLLNQLGFPAVTSTAGHKHWNPEWTPLLRRHCVAVIYDVDAEERARDRAAEFRAAGVPAFPVPLSDAGFRDRDDISDVLIRDGWTIQQFRGYVRGFYRRARRAA